MECLFLLAPGILNPARLMVFPFLSRYTSPLRPWSFHGILLSFPVPLEPYGNWRNHTSTLSYPSALSFLMRPSVGNKAHARVLMLHLPQPPFEISPFTSALILFLIFRCAE